MLSAHSGKGVPEVLRALLDVIDQAREKSGDKQKAEAWQP